MRRLSACIATVALAGCASPIDVRSLATGRSDMVAYELNGSDLDALRREAQRLCPLGGDILRQAGQQQRTVQADGRWRRVLHAATEWIDPPQQSAQLLVQCREAGDRLRLQPAAAPPALPASVAPAEAGLNAALPIGPILPQW